jgi:hypothetical protein
VIDFDRYLRDMEERYVRALEAEVARLRSELVWAREMRDASEFDYEMPSWKPVLLPGWDGDLTRHITYSHKVTTWPPQRPWLTTAPQE